MPILPPKITGDGVEDSWNKSVTDQLNELEVSLQTQLAVTDVRSANYDGSSDLPADLLTTTRTQSDLTNLVGSRGYFLDADVGTIVTDDIMIRGTISAEAQQVSGLGGFTMDGDSGVAQFTSMNVRGGLTSGNALVDLNTLNPTRTQVAASSVLSDGDAWVMTSDGGLYCDQVATNGVAAGGVVTTRLQSSGAAQTIGTQTRISTTNLNTSPTTLVEDAEYVATIETRFTPPSQATPQPLQPWVVSHPFYVPVRAIGRRHPTSNGTAYVSCGIIRAAAQNLGELQLGYPASADDPITLHILLSTSGGNVDASQTVFLTLLRRS